MRQHPHCPFSFDGIPDALGIARAFGIDPQILLDRLRPSGGLDFLSGEEALALADSEDDE